MTETHLRLLSPVDEISLRYFFFLSVVYVTSSGPTSVYRPVVGQLKTLRCEVLGTEVHKVSLRVPGVGAVGVRDPEVPPCGSFW